ncbi:hypothetical protein [Olivibacter ginsenosidimutans]|uniref:hypothetical protein n=1 Tax=Olivibacter ginsenosidimutans TaxID=1176537 RepID=UPI0031E5C39F
MLWIRRIQLPLAILFLMVYGGIQIGIGLHTHSPLPSLDTVETMGKQQVLTAGKHCPICDFLYKKVPEKEENPPVLLSSLFLTLVFPWIEHPILTGLPAIISPKPGRAPPALYGNLLFRLVS